MVVSWLTRGDGGERRIAVDVAGARAVGELSDGVEELARSLDRLRMFRGHIVLGMTPATAPGIGGGRVRDLLGVGRVAALTRQGHAVIARVVGARRVVEADYAPVRIAVAARAVEVRREVIRRQAGRGHVVVAARTVADEGRVIDERRLPAERAVTGVAGSRGDDVRARHPQRLHSVVAGRAG